MFKAWTGLGLVYLAFSQNALSQEKINQLSEVVVTASRSPRKQSETGKVVRVISATQLAQSQGRTLPELLSNIAGLTIGGNGNNPGDIKAVYLRGAGAGNTLILIDGIAVNDASSISGEYDISSIAIDQIERIEILKGGNSTLYGSDAVAGVINIITKKATEQWNTGLILTGGSYGTSRQALALNGGIGQTKIALNASHMYSDGFSSARQVDESASPERDGFRQQGLSVNVQRQVNERFRLHANLQTNTNRADLDDGAFLDGSDNTYKKKSYLVGFGGKYIAGDAVVDFNLSQNKVNNEFMAYGDLTQNVGEITNVETTVSYPLASFVDLISGLSFKRSATDQKSPWGNLAADNQISSLFSSFFLKLNDRFRTELGGRVNKHNVYGTNFTYTLNPSYLIAEKYKVFLNLSSAYKVPSLYQLFSPYGNLDLKPESTRTFEFGADMDLIPGIFRLNLAYFNRNTQDVIDFGMTVSNEFKYLNQLNQRDEGFELESFYQLNDKWRMDAFYAFVIGKQKSSAGDLNNLFRRPKHSAGFNMNGRLHDKLTASLIYKWVGARQDRYYDANLSRSETVNLEGFHLLDAYIQYQAKKNISFFADVKNLLNVDYVDFSGYTTRRFNFNAGLKVDIR